MIGRSEILWLGIGAAVSGCLVGGLMLGIGIALVIYGQPLGWVPLLAGAPVSALIGWVLGRRLAEQAGR